MIINCQNSFSDNIFFVCLKNYNLRAFNARSRYFNYSHKHWHGLSGKLHFLNKIQLRVIEILQKN